MPDLKHWYQTINILSLDVVAGAIASALFFACILTVRLTSVDLIALALSVWIIYTSDHLADAKRINQEASTARHRFHQIHFKPLSLGVLLAVGVNCIALFFMRAAVLRMGMVLAAIICAFMLFQKWVPVIKEFSIALFYTAGIMLPSLAETQRPMTFAQCLLITQFFLVALTNLLLFSWLDRSTDKRDGLKSIVSTAGERNTQAMIWIAWVLQVLLLAIELVLGKLPEASIIVGVMGATLISIFVLQRSADDYDIYRIMGEAVLLMPILYFL